jgi:flagellar assembly protein FliH
MTAPAHRPGQIKPFTFDTVFDGDRVIIPPRPKKVFTPEEVEAVRAQAFAEGQRSVTAQAEAQMAQALNEAAAAMRAAFAHLTELAHAHRTDSARLALACARKIADAALDQFPEQPAIAALEALSRELEAQPRLLVRAHGGDVERLRAALEGAADTVGYAGLVVVKSDPALPRAGFSFDWGEGRAAFDPATALARVEEALETALAAEGLHAEPLVLDQARPA